MADQKNTGKSNESRWLTFDGRTQTITQWAAELGVSTGCLNWRLDTGWPIEEIFQPKVGALRRRADLVGQRFGKLTVLSFAGMAKSRNGLHKGSRWLCRCDCGAEIEVGQSSLRRGQKGCNHCSRISHGHASYRTKTPELTCWKNMLDRCYRPTAVTYQFYGGRGISVCQRWRDSFEAFLEDMGLKPTSQHSIDRINSDGDYCPENCRWATKQVQVNNTRRNVWIEFRGEKMTITQWSERIGIKLCSLKKRLRRWPLERALTEPKSA